MTGGAIPRLHLVGPLDAVATADYPVLAGAAVAGGAGAVHLRLPGARTAELLPLARALRASTVGALLLVNDRPDVALTAFADGVQLPEAGFTVAEARAIAGERALIGRSVHDAVRARTASSEGVDFLLAGHVFDTPSKAGTPGRGLAWLREVVADASVPVIALGGITIERIPAVLAAGARGVALGRELLLAPDPGAAATAARAAIEAALTMTIEEAR